MMFGRKQKEEPPAVPAEAYPSLSVYASFSGGLFGASIRTGEDRRA